MPVSSTPIGRIETISWGDGKDLLLLLHASATGPRALTDLALCLERPTRRVLAPAFSGYGSTRLNQAAPSLNTARNCAIVEKTLGTAHGERRVLFGHSMGGLIALLIALKQAQSGPLFDALVLYEPILHDLLDPTSPPSAEALTWDRDIIAQLAQDVRQGDPERGVRRFVEAWNETNWEALPQSVRQQLVDNADNLVRETAAMPDQGLTPTILAGLNTPTLLLRGDRSPEFTRLVTASALQAIPGARETVLAGCGHMAPLNAPDKVAASINAFLATLASN